MRMKVFIATKNLKNLDKSRHVAGFSHSSLYVDTHELRREGVFSKENKIFMRAKGDY